MKTFKRLRVLVLVTALVMTACEGLLGGMGERPIRTGNVVDSFDFATSGNFEQGGYQGASIRIIEGEYRIEASQGIIWGQGGSTHSDIVIEAEARVESSADDVRYGILCRLDPANNGNGYFFAISPNGHYEIMKGEGDRYNVIREGRAPSGAITDGVNTLRAVCLGTYLALYVNGTFVGSATDNTYIGGLVGMAAGPGQGGPVAALFDNLRTYEVAYAEPTDTPAP